MNENMNQQKVASKFDFDFYSSCSKIDKYDQCYSADIALADNSLLHKWYKHTNMESTSNQMNNVDEMRSSMINRLNYSGSNGASGLQQSYYTQSYQLPTTQQWSISNNSNNLAAFQYHATSTPQSFNQLASLSNTQNSSMTASNAYVNYQSDSPASSATSSLFNPYTSHYTNGSRSDSAYQSLNFGELGPISSAALFSFSPSSPHLLNKAYDQANVAEVFSRLDSTSEWSDEKSSKLSTKKSTVGKRKRSDEQQYNREHYALSMSSESSAPPLAKKRCKIFRLDVKCLVQSEENSKELDKSESNIHPDDEETYYKCTTCSVPFNSLAKLLMHQHKYHNNGMSSQCPICCK
jgi:hypothetical protein